MTRIKKFLALTGALATLTVATVAVAGGPHGAPESVVMQAIKELDLTPEQRDQLKQLREKNREAHEDARADREKTMEVFKAELLSDNPDRKRLHKLIDDRQDEMVQRAHDKLDAVLEVHSVLTSSQREELADTLAEMRARHEKERAERHGERGERRRGR